MNMLADLIVYSFTYLTVSFPTVGFFMLIIAPDKILYFTKKKSGMTEELMKSINPCPAE